MTTKKAPSKRARQGATKRSVSKKKSAGRSAAKKSAVRKSARLKAAPIRVVFDSKAPLSPLAKRALEIFTAGVQDALREFAEKNIPAFVVENGRRIVAVPTKVDGRWMVTDSKVAESELPYVAARKRGTRAG